MRHILVFLVLLGGVAQGQSYRRDYQKHHVSAGLGFAMPGKDLETYYQDAFAWSISYGYRPLKYLQLDAGSHDMIIAPAELPQASSATFVWPSLSPTLKMVDAEMTAWARPVMLSKEH